jgi:lysophospholipase L1-like esterase
MTSRLGVALCLPVAGLVLAGCAGAGDPQRSARTPTPEPSVYVAVGASETVGVGATDPAGEAWPTLLHASQLPDARYVNVGVSGATVRDALEVQLPEALAAQPDVVTVWLVVNDILALVPVSDYERQLSRLVRALRRGGRAEVLVGNAPDLWELPAYRACLPGREASGDPCRLPFVPSEAQVRGRVADFNAAVRRVVAEQGARLVDLSDEQVARRLTAEDGFHPSTAGHRRLSAAFSAALPGG